MDEKRTPPQQLSHGNDTLVESPFVLNEVTKPNVIHRALPSARLHFDKEWDTGIEKHPQSAARAEVGWKPEGPVGAVARGVSDRVFQLVEVLDSGIFGQPFT